MRAPFPLGLVATGLLLAACPTSDGVSPELTDLRLRGQAPDNPLVMLMEADFIDPDGDLSGGFLETYLDGASTSLGELSLYPIFVDSDLPLDATEGLLDFVLELALSPTQLPTSGAEFSLGLRATDEDGHESPLQEVRIRITY